MNNLDNDFIVELQNAFLVEAQDIIDGMEELFLQLEHKPDDSNLLQAIFRAAHNLKGSSKSVGFDSLSQFCHKFETFMILIKDKKIKADKDVFNLILKYVDHIKAMLIKLQENRAYQCCDYNILQETDSLISLKSSESCDDIENTKSEEKNYKNLGDILINEFGVMPEHIDKAAKLQNSKIGEILVDQGVVSKGVVDKALDIQKKNTHLTAKVDEYIRVNLSKIDSILDICGEQLILQSNLEYAKKDVVKNKELIEKTITKLTKVSNLLQQTVLSLRMLPIKPIFNKMERTVRDTANALGKKVILLTEGEDYEIDKSIYDRISDPLNHIIRNAVDHGIEMPQERVKLGKAEVGTIRLKAYTKGGFFNIEICDDGKGLDKNKILNKAIEKGLICKNHNLSDQDIYRLIFKSGFSTKDEATEISGRGVGMDVVDNCIKELKGVCELYSELNKGTTFIIKLPLTLALFNGMIVKINELYYVIPNSDIQDAINIDDTPKRSLIRADENIIQFGDEILKVIDLRKVFNLKNTHTKTFTTHINLNNKQIALIITQDRYKYALLVDDIVSQQKIVYKKLGQEFEGIKGISGGTILGDGSVALILDLNNVIAQYVH